MDFRIQELRDLNKNELEEFFNEAKEYCIGWDIENI